TLRVYLFVPSPLRRVGGDEVEDGLRHRVVGQGGAGDDGQVGAVRYLLERRRGALVAQGPGERLGRRLAAAGVVVVGAQDQEGRQAAAHVPQRRRLAAALTVGAEHLGQELVRDVVDAADRHHALDVLDAQALGLEVRLVGGEQRD